MHVLPLVATTLLTFSLSKRALAHRHQHHSNVAARGHTHHDLDKRLLISSLDDPVDVSMSGDHAWRAPGEQDQRGPCPALNALANHNYIPRNGVVGLLPAVTAVNEVYGMGIELATVLTVMGVVWAGDPISLNPSFSIGGSDTAVDNLLDGVLGILGTPEGLNLSHNFIEADASATRDDLYVTGDPVTMNLTKFTELYNMVPEGQAFGADVMAKYASRRFDESVATNPDFYYGPFTGWIARNAGYFFTLRLFANYSSEQPEGYLSHNHLKSFFGVSGSPSNFTYNKGWERIPDNWYKTPLDWGLVQLNLELLSWIAKYPVLASIGGNVGSVNSFTGVDLSDPVTGLANVPKLLESNNLVCFALQIVKMAAPSYTNNLFATLAAPLNLLLDKLAVPLLNLSCPSMDALTKGGRPLWEELRETFPGAKDSAL